MHSPGGTRRHQADIHIFLMANDYWQFSVLSNSMQLCSLGDRLQGKVFEKCVQRWRLKSIKCHNWEQVELLIERAAAATTGAAGHRVVSGSVE